MIPIVSTRRSQRLQTRSFWRKLPPSQLAAQRLPVSPQVSSFSDEQWRDEENAAPCLPQQKQHLDFCFLGKNVTVFFYSFVGLKASRITFKLKKNTQKISVSLFLCLCNHIKALKLW